MFSKLANWVVWTALTVVVLVLVYRYTEWFKPAAESAITGVKSVVARVPSNPFGKDTSAEKLDVAREAFARGDVDGAVTIYNEIIKGSRGNADAQGELGNVYYLTGRLPEATQAYYDAAKILLEKNELDRVEPLLPAIAEFNPMMADEIAQKLNEAMHARMMANPGNGANWQQPPQSALRRH